MTRQVHDEFAKEYLEELLSPFGQIEKAKIVKTERREIDIFFTPKSLVTKNLNPTGLLETITKTSCLIEPFRNACTEIEIRSCLSKLYSIHEEILRQAKRNKSPLSEVKLPYLWILTPTCSQRILKNFRAEIAENGEQGIYLLPASLQAAIIVIHQLSVNQDTLWLRVLGKGSTQKQAVEELVELPQETLLRTNLLELLANWRKNLELRDNKTREDQEVIMNLSPAYLQDREQWLREGRVEGRVEGELKAKRELIENFFKVRFQILDQELEGIIPTMLQIPTNELTPLLLNLNREQLLKRFKD
jgi:hypothetical protein